MKRKFGEMLDWSRPELLHEYGNNDLRDIDDYERRLIDTICTVRSTLEGMSDEDLQLIRTELADTVSLRESLWGEVHALDVEWVHRNAPPPIAYGFGHPDFAVDFSFWGSMPSLTWHEIYTLALGVNPEVLTESRVENLVESKKKGRSLWSASEQLLKYRELFSRFFRSTGWGFAPASSNDVWRWINRSKIEVHPEFYARLEERFGKRSKTSALCLKDVRMCKWHNCRSGNGGGRGRRRLTLGVWRLI